MTFDFFNYWLLIFLKFINMAFFWWVLWLLIHVLFLLNMIIVNGNLLKGSSLRFRAEFIYFPECWVNCFIKNWSKHLAENRKSSLLLVWCSTGMTCRFDGAHFLGYRLGKIGFLILWLLLISFLLIVFFWNLVSMLRTKTLFHLLTIFFLKLTRYQLSIECVVF